MEGLLRIDGPDMLASAAHLGQRITLELQIPFLGARLQWNASADSGN